jgi:hypothetical protein
MIRLIGIFLLLTWHLTAFSQSANEWINFNQEYFRIPVAKDAIYKVSYSSLQQAGFPVDSDPSLFQLIHRGQEHAVHISGEEDNVFGADDYIVFYGNKNDGTLDEGLYLDPTNQAHKLYNLFSDTTSYFLTVGQSQGRRMQVFQESNAGRPADAYHSAEKLVLFTDQYNASRSFSNEVFLSTFEVNEGWTGPSLRQGQSKDLQITDIVKTFTTGALPEIEILLLGRSAFFHNAQIYIGPSQRLLKSVSFAGFGREVISESIEWSDISPDGRINIRITIPSGALDDQVSVSYVRVTFNQLTDAGGTEKIFRTSPFAAGEAYLEIQNPPPSTDRLYDISDAANVSMIVGTIASSLNVVVPVGGSSRTLLLTNTSITPGSIRKTHFRQFVPGEQNYVIVTHPLLRKPAGSYNDPVEAYAAYRASAEGGSYDTLVVHSRDLYDQFNYGEVSPLAIYRFLQFISKAGAPSYLFLMGKGLELTDQFHRQSNGATWAYQDLVPTGGYPGSDLIFSSGIAGTTYEPGIPTGRLSAMNPLQVATYLDKVRELEAVPSNALWRKNILHLSGGVEEGEPEQFRSILQGLAEVAEGPYLGGHVTALAKKSRDLEVVNVSDQINDGLALVTFFGHSSPRGFDFDLGYVNETELGYHNKGKYPVLLMNGCEAGAFFLRDTIFAESWVYARDKGASAFIAHNSYGLPSVLAAYSRNFYEVAFADSTFFGRGLGDIQKETARRHIEKFSPSIANLSQIQQMVLLGDPALKLFSTKKADLEIKGSQVSVLPYVGSYVNALTDSFAIKMIVNNYGMSPGNTFRIEVERVLADNSTVIYDSLLEVPGYSDTIYFIIRRGSENVAGPNTFHISLDPDNIIDEVSEQNNAASYTLSIPSNGTRNLFPGDYAIVNESDVTLSFQATDLFSGERTFLLEIDTVNTFDSPYIQRFEVEGKVLGRQSVALTELDSVGYYWRTRLRDPLDGEASAWELNSFTFIRNSPEGWAQIHFPQFMENATDGLLKVEESRRFEFNKTVTPVELITYGAAAGKSAKDVSVKIKGSEYNLSVINLLFKCRLNTMNFIAFDKHSSSPYAGIYLKWYEQWSGPVNACGREPLVINSFAWNEVSRGGTRDVIQYVNNVADGDSVVMFNIGNASLNLWPVDAIAKLAELGISSDQISAIGAGEPVVIFGRKGSAPGTAKAYQVKSGDPTVAELVVNESVSGGYDSGTLTSPLIGPAQSWQEIYFHARKEEDHDQFKVDVVGVRLNGSREVLMENISGVTDISAVDADEFTFLQLKISATDTLLLTPAQLKKWIVLFTPVPEGVLLPEHTNNAVTLDEGMTWTGKYRFVNISDQSFPDSVGVRIRHFNHELSETEISSFRIKAPAPSDSTRFEVSKNTAGIAGSNDIQLFVNPRETAEMYYDNNIVQLNNFLNVLKDESSPFIDVTFDERHLINGDNVSANPMISIYVWDDNRFLLKKDTTGVRIFLSYPCETESCNSRNIWLSRNDIKWYPATSGSRFRIDFSPQELLPGTYHFRVDAADATGNPADPYTISFTVSDQRQLQMIPFYPNPLVSHSAFGFHVSADGIPLNFTVEITDMMGKTIMTRSFSEGFHVGRNLFEWNGEDNNGNLVKPGVYPYRLVLNDNGSVLLEQDKIVIMR